MRKKLAFVLLLMFVCMPISVNAANSSTAEMQDSDKLIKVFDQFFSGQGTAYNSANEDVTQEFYNTHIKEFCSGDYDAIKEGLNVEDIACIETYSIIQPTRLEMTKTYEQTRIHPVRQDEYPYEGMAWYIIVTATGSFTYHDSTLQISSYEDPEISVDFADLGALFSGTPTSIKVSSPKYISNRTGISFSVTVKHTVSCPIPGIDYITDTIGPFETVSNFEIYI